MQHGNVEALHCVIWRIHWSWIYKCSSGLYRTYILLADLPILSKISEWHLDIWHTKLQLATNRIQRCRQKAIVYDQFSLSFLWLTIVQRSPRSGFSFLPTPDGILLHGSSHYRGYVPSDPICKLDRWLLQRIRKRQTTNRCYAWWHLVPKVTIRIFLSYRSEPPKPTPGWLLIPQNQETPWHSSGNVEKGRRQLTRLHWGPVRQWHCGQTSLLGSYSAVLPMMILRRKHLKAYFGMICWYI